jgi:hypothetical protein
MLDHHDRDGIFVHTHQDGQDLVDLGMGEAGHRLVHEQKLRFCNHSAREIELAQVDLG